jgi:hypothetical protein
VRETYKSNGVWGDTDLTNATGAPLGKRRRANRSCGFYDSYFKYARFIYIANDGHLNGVYLQSGTWYTSDFTSTTGSGSPMPGSAISGLLDTNQNVPRIDYIGTDSHVHETYNCSTCTQVPPSSATIN